MSEVLVREEKAAQQAAADKIKEFLLSVDTSKLGSLVSDGLKYIMVIIVRSDCARVGNVPD